MNSKRYNIGFSTGALLFEKANSLILGIKSIDDYLQGDEKLDSGLILVNSEVSNRKYLGEINKRLQGINEELYVNYINSDDQTRRLILFYLTCKSYSLITEFLIEVVLEKWLNLDREISTEDFQLFFDLKSETYEELEQVTANTRYKLSQTVLKILKEVGMVKGGQLHKLFYAEDTLEIIARTGDAWFLDVLLLNKIEKEEIIGR